MEKILCSAIYYDDGSNSPSQPVNITTGFVICGRRHCDCIATYLILTGKKTTRNNIQGFLTTNNRFVDRKEALVIARNAKQLIFADMISKESDAILCSEDIILADNFFNDLRNEIREQCAKEIEEFNFTLAEIIRSKKTK